MAVINSARERDDYRNVEEASVENGAAPLPKPLKLEQSPVVDMQTSLTFEIFIWVIDANSSIS